MLTAFDDCLPPRTPTLGSASNSRCWCIQPCSDPGAVCVRVADKAHMTGEMKPRLLLYLRWVDRVDPAIDVPSQGDSFSQFIEKECFSITTALKGGMDFFFFQRLQETEGAGLGAGLGARTGQC